VFVGNGLPSEVQGGTQVAQYLSRIWQLRYFWLSLVKIDLKNRYRRSMIGVGWSLLHPILMTVVLCIVFGQFFHRGDIKSYAPFLLSGLVFWHFITTALNQGCHCFFNGESYIRQHPAPLAIYPLRATLGAGIHFGIGLVLVILMVWSVNGFGNVPSLISLVPSLILIFVFGWSLALIFGVLNVLFQDCQHLIEVLLQVLFYATPIMYEPGEIIKNNPTLVWYIKHANPLAVMLDLLRRPLLYGDFPSYRAYALGIAVVVFFAAIAALTMSKIEKKMIFYL
jgi:ABC-type polysaccharide/polyol phosphate export permease